MTFQGYLDAIKAKTGKGPDDFRALATARGLVAPGVKAGDVVTWLSQDFGLGHGHAMAIYALLKAGDEPRAEPAERVDKLFSGRKSVWRDRYDALLRQVQAFGGDVTVVPTDSYASLVRDGRKFAIVQPAAGHLDIGIKRKHAEPTDRFIAAGDWNRMVTHRARIMADATPDADVIEWLRLAYLEAE